jgi:hypothetical protein
LTPPARGRRALQFASEAPATAEFPPFGCSKEPGLTRFGGVGRNPRTKAIYSQIQPHPKTRNQLVKKKMVVVEGDLVSAHPRFAYLADESIGDSSQGAGSCVVPAQAG